MSAPPTVAELFKVAIQAERATEEMYRRLALMFRHVVPVARLIELYASEESGHAIWLDSLRRKVAAEKLAAPAIPTIYQDALNLSELPVSQKLEGIKTLEDAFNLIYEVEHGEINQVLNFLITTYYEDQKTELFLRDHLLEHIDRLQHELPEEYGTPEARLRVTAIQGGQS